MKLHITDKALKELNIERRTAKRMIFDEEQTGFAVAITPEGSMTYVIVYRDEHRRSAGCHLTWLSGSISTQLSSDPTLAETTGNSDTRRSVSLTTGSIFWPFHYVRRLSM